ncbi:MAG: phosphatidylglycerophosphatase A [Puniceicoccales bacterium]|nr:phosphatidylglycerophosphatase A [Puniceicoccales bacterium]
MKFGRFAVAIATLFGIGTSPVFPGTLGSFFGTLLYALAIQNLKASTAIFTVIFLVLVAIVICDMAEKEIGEVDPGCIVLDEFVAMPICFIGVRNLDANRLLLIAAGFVIFRIFDIFKPLGIKRTQNLSGGIGIVIDDVVAAFYTNITLALICLTIL